jgi:hypothetical protein
MTTTTREDKDTIHLSSEFRVCAELLKRKIDCSLTYGNKKATDIIVHNFKIKELAIVEVKSSVRKYFVTSLFQKYQKTNMRHPDFWVFVRFAPNVDEKFYILTHTEVINAQKKHNKTDKLSYEKAAEKVKKGVDKLLEKEIQVFENRWEKIEDYSFR